MLEAPIIGVLGATGFIGRSTCQALESRGAVVVPLRTPRLACAHELPLEDQVQRRGREITLPIRGRMDALVNCAGNPDASSRSDDLYGVNALLPATLAHVAGVFKIPRLVHVSSAVVQGTRDVLNEDPPPARGPTTYADSKVQGERLLTRSAGRLPVEVCSYRPPSVHSEDRRITRSLSRISRMGLGVVAAPGTNPSPQALLGNVADAIAFLAVHKEAIPPVVIHPWEGLTTADLLTALGGRAPRRLPKLLARAAVKATYSLSVVVPQLRPNARRADMMLFGQGQAPSWLTTVGWSPPLGRAVWYAIMSNDNGDA